ncbi:hypothetical protein Tco_0530881 [Tanacetum coccineum]
MDESAKRHDENSNLIKEIRASTDAAIRNQGASIKALEIWIGQMSKEIQERRYGSLPSSTETNPRDHVKSISTCEEAETPSIRHALPPKEKDPRSFTLPCYINNISFNKALANLGASVSVMPYSTFTNLGLGGLAPTKLIVELADRTVKCSKGIVENVLVGIDKFVFPVDFIVLDMPKDIKIPLILRRPFLSTPRAKIDVFERKIALRVGNEKLVFKSDNPTNNIFKKVYVLGLRERMELDLMPRLMGEALILNRSQDPDYEDFLEPNDLNKPLELRRNQEVDNLGPIIKEGEVIDKLMVDIVKTRHDDQIIEGIDEYPIVENIDAYRDEDMGDVIVGIPFCRASCVEARWFDGLITIHDGTDNVSARDKLEGILHPYQKLKCFYKGVLNLGPEYIRDAKTVEWITRGHVSMHEME